VTAGSGKDWGEGGGGDGGGGGEWGPDGLLVPISTLANGTSSNQQGRQQNQPRMAASMPSVDIHEGAAVSLAASKQAAVNGR
jgi:hypothetical protein